jgi:hypothetical protein
MIGNGTSYVDTAITQIGASSCSGSYPADSCYRVYTDGVKEAWGHIQITFPSATLATGSISYPNTAGNAFTGNPVVTLWPNDNADGSNNFNTWGDTPTTAGINVNVRCAVNIGGSGCGGGLTSTVTMSWRAIGN